MLLSSFPKAKLFTAVLGTLLQTFYLSWNIYLFKLYYIHHLHSHLVLYVQLVSCCGGLHRFCLMKKDLASFWSAPKTTKIIGESSQWHELALGQCLWLKIFFYYVRCFFWSLFWSPLPPLFGISEPENYLKLWRFSSSALVMFLFSLNESPF